MKLEKKKKVIEWISGFADQYGITKGERRKAFIKDMWDLIQLIENKK